MKKISVVLMLTIVFSMLTLCAVSAQSVSMSFDSVTVMVNDDESKEPNILYQDRTYVQLRGLAEKLGCVVNWDEATSTALITGEITTEGVNLLPTRYQQDLSDIQNAYEMNKAFATGDLQIAALDKKFLADKATLDAQYRAEAAQKVQPEQTVNADLNVITVKVNGEVIDEPNILYQDRTYIPFRAVFSALGCEVLWDDITQTATIKGRLVIEEVYTSFEEEYEPLKELYKAKVEEQILLGEQAYQGAINRSVGGTGGQAEGQVQHAEEAKAEFVLKADQLKQEYSAKVLKLVNKYQYTGYYTLDPLE